jgi:hypothetical protein
VTARDHQVTKCSGLRDPLRFFNQQRFVDSGETPEQRGTFLELFFRAFDRALLLHMAALASIEGIAVKGDQGVLDHALDRERRFWQPSRHPEAIETEPFWKQKIGLPARQSWLQGTRPLCHSLAVFVELTRVNFWSFRFQMERIYSPHA